jgi:hypothetical protein
MTRSTMSAVACAVSLLFATPLFAQTPSATDQTMKSPATTSTAPTTPPPAATPSSCAGLTGTALSDCQNAENASNALCFGMNEKVRADCVKSYYPNSPQGQATKPATGQSSMTTTPETGTAATAPAGSTGAGIGTGGASNGGRVIQQ